MFIVAQNRSRVINMDNVLEIYFTTDADLDNKPETITYYTTDKWGNEYRLAEYEYTPEHENLIEKIAQSAGAINVFYMPEE